MEGGKNGTHEIKKVSSKPNVHLVMTDSGDYLPHKSVKLWELNELQKYDKETVSKEHVTGRADPYFIFHNETVLAVTPIGEAFQSGVHPTLTIKNPYSINKFMNLNFNKFKLNNITTDEID